MNADTICTPVRVGTHTRSAKDRAELSSYGGQTRTRINHIQFSC